MFVALLWAFIQTGQAEKYAIDQTCDLWPNTLPTTLGGQGGSRVCDILESSSFDITIILSVISLPEPTSLCTVAQFG